MPQNIVLAPCSNEVGKENLERTVLNSVQPEMCSKYTELDLDEPVGIWGTGEHNKGTWKRINECDILLFYTGEFCYKYAARIIGKEVNKDLAIRLWSSEDDDKMRRPFGQRSWRFLLFLEEIKEVNIDSEELHDYANYVRGFPMQFKLLLDKGVEAIVEEYGGVQDYVYGQAFDDFSGSN